MSLIKTLNQIVEINDVEAVVVTDLQTTQDAKSHIRAIKIIGAPLGSTGEPNLILEIRLTANDKDKIEIKTPNLYF